MYLHSRQDFFGLLKARQSIKLNFMKSITKEHITTFSQVLLFYLSEKHFFPKPKHTVMKWHVSVRVRRSRKLQENQFGTSQRRLIWFATLEKRIKRVNYTLRVRLSFLTERNIESTVMHGVLEMLWYHLWSDDCVVFLWGSSTHYRRVNSDSTRLST